MTTLEDKKSVALLDAPAPTPAAKEAGKEGLSALSGAPPSSASTREAALLRSSGSTVAGLLGISAGGGPQKTVAPSTPQTDNRPIEDKLRDPAYCKKELLNTVQIITKGSEELHKLLSKNPSAPDAADLDKIMDYSMRLQGFAAGMQRHAGSWMELDHQGAKLFEMAVDFEAVAEKIYTRAKELKDGKEPQYHEGGTLANKAQSLNITANAMKPLVDGISPTEIATARQTAGRVYKFLTELNEQKAVSFSDNRKKGEPSVTIAGVDFDPPFSPDSTGLSSPADQTEYQVLHWFGQINERINYLLDSTDSKHASLKPELRKLMADPELSELMAFTEDDMKRYDELNAKRRPE